MEEFLLLSVTFLFALYGLSIMKKVDLFIDNNLTSSYKIIYLDDSLLIKYFNHLSNVHFDMEKKSFKKIYSMIEKDLIDIAIFTNNTHLTTSNTLKMTEIQMNIYSNYLFSTIYVLHKKDEDIKWINQ